jgi:CubicO group peptidase (beta-lactamase class C family)
MENLTPRIPATSKRRLFRRWESGAALAVLISLTALPPTVQAQSPMDAFDQEVRSFMRGSGRQITSGSLAVTYKGKLIYARGYTETYPDNPNLPPHPDPVSETTLFRIASLSKPITAAAVLRWIESTKGEVTLDTPVWEYIGLRSEPADPRWKKITFRNLLQHAGGWDIADLGYDPMFYSRQIASSALGQKKGWKEPISRNQIIEYMQGERLSFDPGSRYAYSNFGYAVLGRILEKNGGYDSYERFVVEKLLKPLDIVTNATAGMKLGASLDSGPGEANYYDHDGRTGASVFPDDRPGQVPLPYGAFNLEAMDAHGGWTASAVALAKFAVGLDKNLNGLLAPEDRIATYAKPTSYAAPAANYYGFGWLVVPTGPAVRGEPVPGNYWHNGSLPGTFSYMARMNMGVDVIGLFNGRDESDLNSDTADFDSGVWRAINSVKNWPTEDLFPRYFPVSGDVNGDGKVNVQDCALVLRFAVGLADPTTAQRNASDVNGDGRVNVQDATLLLKRTVGLG